MSADMGVPGGRFNGTLGGIAGGAGAFLQGLIQGKLLHNQELQQQQALQSEQLANGMKLYGMLAQIGESDPDALRNPQLLQYVKRFSGGLPIPTDPTTGAIDVNAFKQPLSKLTGDASLYSQFNQYEPGSPQRQQMLNAFGGQPDQIQSLLNAPRVYTPAEQDAAAGTLRYLTGLAANATVDTNSPSFIDQYNAAAKIAGRPPWQAVGVGERVRANIGKTDATTQHINASTYWMNQTTPVRIANWNALTNKANVESWAIPQRIAISARNAASAAERADDNHTKTLQDVQAFQQLGTTPQALSAYNGLIARFQNQVQLDKTALQNVRQAIDAIYKNNLGKAPTPGSFAASQLEFLSKEQQRLQGRFDASSGALRKFMSGQSMFNQKVLHHQGAPASWQLPPEVNSAAFNAPTFNANADGSLPSPSPAPSAAPSTSPTPNAQAVDAAWNAVQAMPKAKAIAAIKSSTRLSESDKQALLQRLNAVP